MDGATFSTDDFLTRATQRLRFDLPADVFSPAGLARSGDHTLAPDLIARPLVSGPPKPAAVLIPVIARPEGPTVLLTERASKLRAHSGQIAFPGGRMDDDDATPVATALREAQEEIGLEADFIRPLGYLDAYQTGTGYRIIPVAAVVQPGFALTLNPHEVVDTFEAPLGFLMSVANHKKHHWEREGQKREAWAMPWGERFIWGVTAGILRGVYERLYA